MYIYLPNFTGSRTLAALHAVGLETLHDDGLSLEFADVLENGPDGGSGVICGWGAVGKITAYRPAAQEWHKVVKHTRDDGRVLEAGRAWIGWDLAEPPTPENLLRRKQLGGELLKLDDEREWLIPLAEQLPKRVGLNDEGKISLTVAPLYKAFYEYAWGTLQKYAARDGEIVIDYEYGFDACTRILAMNYRVSRDLVSVLGLIGSRQLWTIPGTCCEAEACADYVQKKRAPESQPTTNGEPA